MLEEERPARRRKVHGCLMVVDALVGLGWAMLREVREAGRTTRRPGGCLSVHPVPFKSRAGLEVRGVWQIARV